MDAPPIVCTLTEPELRERRAGLLRRVRERVLEVRPAAAGVELRFAGDDETTVADVLELVRLESRCCAFLRFRVTLEPGNGPVVLEISGPPGAAQILIGELAAGAPPTGAGAQQ
jgi:hypothetical protein